MGQIIKNELTSEVKMLPIAELPCKECGSRHYISTIVESKTPDKHICNRCLRTIPVSRQGKACRCGANVTEAKHGCDDGWTTGYYLRREDVKRRSRFICADCGSFRSIYMVEYGQKLNVVDPEDNRWSVEFDSFRIKVETGFTTKRQCGVSYLQVFSKYHAFKGLVKKIVHFVDEKRQRVVEESWTQKLARKKLDAASKRLYPIFSNWWDEFVHPTPETVVAQKNVFSCAGSFPDTFLNEDEIWSNPIAVKDMAAPKGKGACMSLMAYKQAKWQFKNDSYQINDPFADGSLSVEEYVKKNFPTPDRWMDVFIVGKKLPRAARVTLMNLPGGISAQSIAVFFDETALNNIGRPRTSRLEFLVWRFASENHHLCEARPWIGRVLLAATVDQIRKAYGVYSEHMLRFANQPKLSLRKTRTLYQFLSWLTDMDEVFHGTSIIKLTEAVARWHQTAHLRRNQGTLERMKIKGTFPTLLPAKELPTYEHGELSLLRTAEELLNNGTTMGHCVGSYIPFACGLETYKTSHIFTLRMCEAVDGKTKEFLATAEVSIEGVVVQSRGPHNCQNAASAKLDEILKEWVQNWPCQDELKAKIVRRKQVYRSLRYGETCDVDISVELAEIREHMFIWVEFGSNPELPNAVNMLDLDDEEIVF